jgi:vacuolar protein sorting-associated protein 11
LGYCVKVGRLT